MNRFPAIKKVRFTTFVDIRYYDPTEAIFHIEDEEEDIFYDAVEDHDVFYDAVEEQQEERCEKVTPKHENKRLPLEVVACSSSVLFSASAVPSPPPPFIVYQDEPVPSCAVAPRCPAKRNDENDVPRNNENRRNDENDVPGVKRLPPPLVFGLRPGVRRPLGVKFNATLY